MTVLAELSTEEIKQFMADKFPEMGVPAPDPNQQRRIMIGILAYDAKMYCKTSFSILQAAFAIARKGWELSFCLREGDSMVARGRNVLISKFMEDEKCTDLVMVDCDLDFEPDHLVRLCEHEVDVVAGAYPFKDGTGQFPLRWSADGLFEHNGLWEVMAVTPGFFRVTRNAILRMQSQMPWLQYTDNALGLGKIGYMFFDNLHRSNGIWDEGFVFCERWRTCGGKVYLDPKAHITHIGMHAYNHGTVVNWLERTAENLEKLTHELPHVPPLKLMPFASKKRIDQDAVDREFSDKGTPGAVEAHLTDNTTERLFGHDDDNGVGGRGRPADLGNAEDAPNGRPATRIGEATGGHEGGEMRPGANGGAGGYLPTRC